ncbi:aldehyde ferredoxin oxidoreductase C-terminal domain-containing protein [Bacillus sp. FJAT-50079]|uniref:aldehyde ferredoxin oxidoreductase family protein n=1 Tax=Bacillus sp. FJAT-50079 TaxID=2833577 RepID=UPI001BC92162|nr:aldehyde ferredoxin oxidoreductase C-terminal domain-containing protein [Bacillus sp. FJAT-50079]MBS4207987.1 hypothetical protein [Bacillus sp. FJAT-50079]
MAVYGYHQKIAHIDLATRTTKVETMDENWYRIYAGGGLLGTYFMLRDTPAKIDAYDPENLLIFASSIIAGNDGPGLARFSVITKSPLSQGIGETRCEGPWAQSLKGSGFDAIIIHGKSETPVYVMIEDGNIDVLEASLLWGKDTNETTSLLEERHGKDEIEVATIGKAGENLVRYASIVTSRSNQAMRLGVGAVMGSKNVKAVVIKGKNLPPIFDEQRLKEVKQEFATNMLTNELSMWQKEAPGFSAWVDLADDDTAYLGVENFKKNLFPARENYSRDRFLQYYEGSKACPGCPNDCIKYLVPNADVPKKSTGIHQEVTGSLGPNIGNENLQLMLEMNALCNLLGLDPVSLGFTISFVMECYENGVLMNIDTDGMELHFGNEKDIVQLISNIATRTGFGDVLAEGSKRAAEKIGERAKDFALHVKGIEMVSFEPRSQTNLGLGYATAPIGPRYDISEHDWDYDVEVGWSHTMESSRTLGILERIPMQYVGPDKVKNFKALNNVWSACDALNLCVFASAPTRVFPLNGMAELVEIITGWKTSSYELMKWGARRNHLMRIYNIREGMTKEDDRLPERFYKEPLKIGRLASLVLNEETFTNAIETYYEMMGYDKNGIPLNGTLYDFDLEWTLPIIENARKVKELTSKG